MKWLSKKPTYVSKCFLKTIKCTSTRFKRTLSRTFGALISIDLNVSMHFASNYNSKQTVGFIRSYSSNEWTTNSDQLFFSRPGAVFATHSQFVCSWLVCSLGVN